jgi:uncharacterized membrane protein (UPF0127 family)
VAEINLIGVADNDAKRELGLMYVRDLPESSGLLFKFDSPRVLSFWMRDTYLALDIAFIDKDGLVVKTESMLPLSTRSVSSGRPCVMALEARAGTFGKMGIAAGKRAVVVDDKVVRFE